MLDLLFPDCCPVCLKPVFPKGASVHEECRNRLQFITPPFCMKCGRKIGEDTAEFCTSCKTRKFSFDAGRCTFIYRSEIGRAIRMVKEEGTREFVDFFGRCATESNRDFLLGTKPEAIIPIPVFKKKLRVRGFNQAELFAKSLSERTGIPVLDVLVKTKNTKDQKGLNKSEREANLAGAFEISGSAGTLPRKVLLVDDIYTTGSTVNTCSLVLKAAGVKKVYFICIAASTGDD